MPPAILVVLGYPGTGKYTVSKELITRLAEDGREVRLVDNHSTANVLFELIAEADGKSVLPPQVLDNVREMNLIVARTIEEVSPPEWSFVFTHHLRDDERNRSYMERLEAMARHRGSMFLPVVLTCQRDVLLLRVADLGRRTRNKLVDPSIATEIFEAGMLVPTDSLVIDTTLRTPSETAGIIQEHLVQRAVAPLSDV